MQSRDSYGEGLASGPAHVNPKLNEGFRLVFLPTDQAATADDLWNIRRAVVSALLTNTDTDCRKVLVRVASVKKPGTSTEYMVEVFLLLRCSLDWFVAKHKWLTIRCEGARIAEIRIDEIRIDENELAPLDSASPEPLVGGELKADSIEPLPTYSVVLVAPDIDVPEMSRALSMAYTYAVSARWGEGLGNIVKLYGASASRENVTNALRLPNLKVFAALCWGLRDPDRLLLSDGPCKISSLLDAVGKTLAAPVVHLNVALGSVLECPPGVRTLIFGGGLFEQFVDLWRRVLVEREPVGDAVRASAAANRNGAQTLHLLGDEGPLSTPQAKLEPPMAPIAPERGGSHE